jgi:hypothetical protein
MVPSAFARRNPARSSVGVGRFISWFPFGGRTQRVEWRGSPSSRRPRECRTSNISREDIAFSAAKEKAARRPPISSVEHFEGGKTGYSTWFVKPVLVGLPAITQLVGHRRHHHVVDFHHSIVAVGASLHGQHRPADVQQLPFS